MSSTIYALSSGRPPSGVAVIRVSGQKARFAYETICGPLPPPRRLVRRSMLDAGGETIDEGLVAWLPGPLTFSGEDSVELFPHGGPAVVDALLARLASLDGLRLAEPGEFTRRAFLNGKLDLAEAEALADLVASETDAQRRFALGNAQGHQRTLYEGWRQRLIYIRAMIEAEFDFADEGDVPDRVSDRVWNDLDLLNREIAAHVENAHVAEIIRDGYRVVIAGPPNAGKSSLLNTLAKRDAAIVSDIPGTTRDIVEVSLSVAGYKVIVQDTAGLRHSADPVEAMGISRSRSAMEQADLVVMLIPPDFDADGVVSDPGKTLRVESKCDLTEIARDDCDVAVSAKTGLGIDLLLAELARRLAQVNGANSMLPARRRHVDLLNQASHCIRSARQAGPLELRAESLRLAGDAIGRISGAVTTEDLLDVIFRDFCVGK